MFIRECSLEQTGSQHLSMLFTQKRTRMNFTLDEPFIIEDQEVNCMDFVTPREEYSYDLIW
jgi:hypothetical protein